MLVGDVHVLGNRIAAILANARHRGLGASIVNVGDDDASSFSGEEAGSRLADSRSRPCDEADLVLQPRPAHAFLHAGPTGYSNSCNDSGRIVML